MDMYAQTVDRGAARGIDVLVDSSVTIAGVRFVGGTLWTDQRIGAHSRGHAWNTARRGMNDYRRIRRRASGRHHNIRVDDTAAMHAETRSTIEAHLRHRVAEPTVVVTHHAPSPHSLSDPTMDLRWCYASDLHDLMTDIGGPDLWVHGHLHNHSEYSVGRTGVVANPRGHVEEAATSGFIPNYVIDIAPDGTRTPGVRS